METTKTTVDFTLDRDVRTANSTTGRLYCDNVFECFIMEDVDRGLKQSMPLAEIADRKLKGLTAIPEGRYEIVRTFSNRFQKVLPILLDVPGYDGIRIHTGNTAANTEGCLLPGTERKQDIVLNSRVAFGLLDKKIEKALASGKRVFITIKW